MTSLGILEILGLKGFDMTRPAMFVRHREPDKYDLDEFLRRGWLETYQAFQSEPSFDDCERIVSFIGTEARRARFIGVYRVGKKLIGTKIPLPPGCPAEVRCDIYYELTRDLRYQDLENRVTIEWGGSTRRWYQWAIRRGKVVRDKEVVQVLPKGAFRPPFRDYLEFTLTHSELEDLYANPEANAEWRVSLAAVAGVYLVLATTTGQQYVGSAHGEEGISGRWAAYAQNGHGGNEMLRRLVDTNSEYPAAFLYSILQILPKTFTRTEVLQWERHYKNKLGSRALGLNLN